MSNVAWVNNHPTSLRFAHQSLDILPRHARSLLISCWGTTSSVDQTAFVTIAGVSPSLSLLALRRSFSRPTSLYLYLHIYIYIYISLYLSLYPTLPPFLPLCNVSIFWVFLCSKSSAFSVFWFACARMIGIYHVSSRIGGIVVPWVALCAQSKTFRDWIWQCQSFKISGICVISCIIVCTKCLPLDCFCDLNLIV